jgi:hypothetical protein
MTPPTPRDAWAGFRAPGKMSECRHARLPTSKVVEEGAGDLRPWQPGRRPPKRLRKPLRPLSRPFGHLAGYLSVWQRRTRHVGLALRPVSCFALANPGRMSEWLDWRLSSNPRSPRPQSLIKAHRALLSPLRLRQKVRNSESRRFGAGPARGPIDPASEYELLKDPAKRPNHVR